MNLIHLLVILIVFVALFWGASHLPPPINVVGYVLLFIIMLYVLLPLVGVHIGGSCC